MIAIGFAIVALAASAPATMADNNRCGERIGSTIVPQSFNQILTSLPKAISPKGEFETTSTYDARVTVATRHLADAVVIARPVDPQTYPEPLSYDADLQMLNVRSTAFDWGTANWDLAFALADQKGVVSRGRYDVATVITRTDRQTGSYRAANVFGASTSVSKDSRATDSLWARVGRDKNDHLFVGESGSIIGSIPLSVAQAKLLKPQLRFALVVAPKHPFLVTGTMLETVPTLDDGRLVTEKFRILIADIQCGLVLDTANRVLGAFPAK